LVRRQQNDHLRKRGRFSGRATPEEVQHQRDQRYDQQEVNQPTGNVEREESQHPHYKQDNKQRYKHLNLLRTFVRFLRGDV
jgi:hypothetical protein